MIVFASLAESLALIDHRWWAIAVGSLLLAITVIVFARLRFIQTRPIRACIVLSIVAHGLIFGSAQLLRLFEAPRFPGDNTIQFQLSMDDVTFQPLEEFDEEEEPLVEPQIEPPEEPTANQIAKQSEPAEPVELIEPPKLIEPPEPEPVAPVELAKPATTPRLPDPESFIVQQPEPDREPKATLTPVPEIEPVTNQPQVQAIEQARAPVAPESSNDIADPPIEVAPPAPHPIAKADNALPTMGPAKKEVAMRHEVTPNRTTADQRRLEDVPTRGDSPPTSQAKRADDGDWRHVSRRDDTHDSRYELRDETSRAQTAKRRGGTESSEAAVDAALRWLVKNQEPDGHWSAAKHQAGRGGFVEGQLRQTTGIQADTGISGLAMLALLGSGHSHQRGSHRKAVQRGLEYLCKQQREDGSLGGNAGAFAQMYCHGIATLALCEAFGMTQDKRIESFARRAVGHTVRSQHRTTGGWRYYPGDPGDTSQFGWQLMVLESARAAGIDVPEKSRQLAHRFLSKVASGAHDGYAGYRPGQVPTVSMSAEALACRSFLGTVDRQLQQEASDYIIRHAPGRSKHNLYYWYYGSLALHQLDSEHWPTWNTALQNALIPTQRRDGRFAGSWDTNTVWGGVGGRVYTTAMAALCLEVYYRYAPTSELARRNRRSGRDELGR